MQIYEPDRDRHHFTREHGVLSWDGCSLETAAHVFGTPLYVASDRALEEGLAGVRAAFAAAGIDVAVHFSCKTNPLVHTLRTLTDLGCGLEVVADHELELARELGIEGERLIVNGTVKSTRMLEEAVEMRAALINVESLEELERVAEAGESLGERVNVGLRINPAVTRSRFDMTLSTSARHSPIGFVPGSDVWRAALALLRDKPVLRLRGVHFHLGSGIASERPYRRGIAAAVQTLEGLYARGFSPSLLDIGGGFGAHRAPTLGLLDSIGRLAGRAVGRGDGSLAMLLPNVARQLELALAAFGERCGRLRPRVIIEPGRSLVASSQILLLTVLRTESRGSHHYAFCDAGAMSLSSSLLTEYHAIELVNRTGPRSKRTWTILGNLPTPLDRVAVLDSLPDLERGDILAVMDVGAYFLALGNTFAGPRPAIVRATPVGPELLRRRERTWDLNGRDVDVMPDDVLQSWRATG